MALVFSGTIEKGIEYAEIEVVPKKTITMIQSRNLDEGVNGSVENCAVDGLHIANKFLTQRALLKLAKALLGNSPAKICKDCPTNCFNIF